MFTRDLTKRIEIGSVPVGGGAPVSVQSMTKTDTRNLEATVSQLKSLAIAGCDIVRVAVPDREAVEALPEILEKSPVPIVADIHFNADLAIASIDKGVHGVRINPGNIDEHGKIRAIAEKAGEKGIPIRVGANSGSLNEHALKKAAGKIDSDIGIETHALVESVLAQCAMLEKYGFEQIKVSLKSSSVPVTTAACRLFAERSPYPQHLGVTEAGSPVRGVVKSAVGIGSLLLDGIGDTIRVSLTSDPVAEVNAGLPFWRRLVFAPRGRISWHARHAVGRVSASSSFSPKSSGKSRRSKRQARSFRP